MVDFRGYFLVDLSPKKSTFSRPADSLRTRTGHQVSPYWTHNISVGNMQKSGQYQSPSGTLFILRQRGWYTLAHVEQRSSVPPLTALSQLGQHNEFAGDLSSLVYCLAQLLTSVLVGGNSDLGELLGVRVSSAIRSDGWARGGSSVISTVLFPWGSRNNSRFEIAFSDWNTSLSDWSFGSHLQKVIWNIWHYLWTPLLIHRKCMHIKNAVRHYCFFKLKTFSELSNLLHHINYFHQITSPLHADYHVYHKQCFGTMILWQSKLSPRKQTTYSVLAAIHILVRLRVLRSLFSVHHCDQKYFSVLRVLKARKDAIEFQELNYVPC